MKFDELVSKEFSFYGVDGELFKLGRKVWCAVEDESDGYRSYLDSIVVSAVDGVFFKRPLARVKVTQGTYYEDGYELVDVEDGHVWLRIGTDHSDDYYPVFRFEYEPKALKS